MVSLFWHFVRSVKEKISREPFRG